MNVVGILFGVSLALALVGGAGAAFSRDERTAVHGLAGAMLGIAGLCLALGNDFIAIMIVIVMVMAIPALLLLTMDLAPALGESAEPRRSAPLMAVGALAGGGVLAWLLVRTSWLPAGGARQNSIEWLGSRFLSDHLVLQLLLAAFLALAAIGATALLNGRTEVGS